MWNTISDTQYHIRQCKLLVCLLLCVSKIESFADQKMKQKRVPNPKLEKWKQWRQWGKSRASPVKRPILRFVDRPLNEQSCNLPISREMTPSCNLTISRAMTPCCGFTISREMTLPCNLTICGLTISRAMTPPCNLTISRDVAILWFEDLSWWRHAVTCRLSVKWRYAVMSRAKILPDESRKKKFVWL